MTEAAAEWAENATTNPLKFACPDPAAHEYPKGYDRCSYCFGHGLVTGYMGEPTDCGHCGMSGIERKRDEKGRYAS